MTVTLGSSTLVASQSRASDGSPIGPADLRIALSPGVVLRDFVGADRTAGEHVRADHGTVTFTAERIFPTPAAALAYMKGDFLAEASEGALKFDGETVLPNAAVTSRTAALVGCAVAVSYSIEG